MGEHRWLIIMQCPSLAILVDLIGVHFGCMWRVLYRIVFLLPYAVFQIYNSAGNRPDSNCVYKIAGPVVMSFTVTGYLFGIANIHRSRCSLPFRSVHRHAALNTVWKVVSYFDPSSISLILCRRFVGHHTPMVFSVSDIWPLIFSSKWRCCGTCDDTAHM